MPSTPINAPEFVAAPPLAVPQSQPFAAAEPTLSRASAHDFNAMFPPTEQNRVKWSETGAPASDANRFKKIFTKKTSYGGETPTGRQALLKPLLEKIASCR
jgi:hypothetical protein